MSRPIIVLDLKDPGAVAKAAEGGIASFAHFLAPDTVDSKVVTEFAKRLADGLAAPPLDSKTVDVVTKALKDAGTDGKTIDRVKSVIGAPSIAIDYKVLEAPWRDAFFGDKPPSSASASRGSLLDVFRDAWAALTG